MRGMCLLVFAGCANDPSVEIVRPLDGATITTDPIELEIRARNLSPYEGDLFLDGALVPRSGRGSGDCNGEGTSLITWTAATVANGPHDVRIDCLEDLVHYPSQTITLVFAR